MDDAFQRIMDICNAVRVQCNDFRPTNETITISKDFEKEIIESLKMREIHRANDMMEFLAPERIASIPHSLNGYMLMGIKIEVNDEII